MATRIIERTVRLPQITDAMLRNAVTYVEQIFEEYDVPAEERDSLWACFATVVTRILLRHGELSATDWRGKRDRADVVSSDIPKELLCPIPGIPRELDDPIQALARSAYTFRGVLMEAAAGHPIPQIVSEREDVLRLADQVLNTWCAHLGLEMDEE